MKKKKAILKNWISKLGLKISERGENMNNPEKKLKIKCKELKQLIMIFLTSSLLITTYSLT